MSGTILSVDTGEVLKKGDLVWVVQTTIVGSAPKQLKIKSSQDEATKYYKQYDNCLTVAKSLNKKHKKLS